MTLDLPTMATLVDAHSETGSICSSHGLFGSTSTSCSCGKAAAHFSNCHTVISIFQRNIMATLSEKGIEFDVQHPHSNRLPRVREAPNSHSNLHAVT